jgi:hypothetical protein
VKLEHSSIQNTNLFGTKGFGEGSSDYELYFLREQKFNLNTKKDEDLSMQT